MYICLCNGITEKDIQKAAQEGCTSLVELRKKMDIANECGKCRKQAINVLRESQVIDDGLLIASFA
ncbi:bacterioferritin-associated ferredoxin [Catenovulum sediminis]|uniref:Bacterioferritin-associated ferredoxin n=1 Tax=Catenovulum sediminis TaxID=1740262 RepID=A0ABV1RER5_9ALTE